MQPVLRQGTPTATAHLAVRAGGPTTVTLAPLAAGMGHTLGQALRGALAGAAGRVEVGVHPLPDRDGPGGERLVLALPDAGVPAAAAALADGAARLLQLLDGVVVLLTPAPTVPTRMADTESRPWVPEHTGPGAFLGMPIHALELSLRVCNALIGCNIYWTGDLLACTEAELLRMPNLGRRGVREVRDALLSRGVVLGMRVPGWPSPGWRAPGG